MKNLLFCLIVVLFNFGCKKDEVKVIPTVALISVNGVTSNSAICTGEILSDGGENSVRGICWSTNQSPTINDATTTNGVGIGSFTSSISGLKSGTDYYIRAFGTNSIGTAYSNQITFKTLALLPTLTTTNLSVLTYTTANSGGNISNDGGAPITVRGVCWSNNQNPTTADSKTIDGSGIGIFTSSITGLLSNTIYYLRAYATNIQGTAYGDQIIFSIKSDVDATTVTDIDGNIYKTVKIGTQTWMAEDLKVKHYQNGDAISYPITNDEWVNIKEGAYTKSVAKIQYNWRCIIDKRNISPLGWHIPTFYEWDALFQYLGGQSVAGGKMKQAGTETWFPPNTGASNTSGFNAIPTARRSGDGSLNDIGESAWWWGLDSTPHAIRVNNISQSVLFHVSFDSMNTGICIRCVKD